MSTEVKPYESPAEDFESYRALSAAAVTSVLFGLLGAVAFLSYALVLVPILGLLCGFYALWQIRERSNELTGRGLAWIGTGLSAFCMILGPVTVTIVEWTEAWPGYDTITYEMLQPE